MSPKKSIIFIIFLLIGLGLFLPSFCNATTLLAMVGNFLFGKIAGFAGAIINTIAKLTLFTWISQAAFRFALGFLAWVTGPNFLAGVSYTRNDFVTTGWQIVRDFCNAFYILIVIAIGIGVALRIREYQIKKLIPKLVASVLLINFTPVICGVIIDASNILMNTFLQGGTSGLSSMVIESVTSIGDVLGRMFHLGMTLMTLRFREAGNLAFDSILTITYNFYGTFIVLALALLFIMRYLALWTFVILAPLAFLCWVLPGLERFWSLWWRQFLSWCFVGIGGAFFLYLGGYMAQHIQSLITVPGATLGLSTQGLSGILIYIFPLTFLFIGYTLTFQYAPMGAEMALGLVRRLQGYTTAKLGKPTIQRWRRVFSREGLQVPEKWRARIAKMKGVKPEQLPGVGKVPVLRNIVGWGLRGTARGIEKIVRVSTQGLREQEEGYKEAMKRDMLGALALLREYLRVDVNKREAAAGVIRALAEKGLLSDAMSKEKAGVSALTKKEMKEAYRLLSEMHHYFRVPELKKAIGTIEKTLSHDEDALNEIAKISHELIPKEKRGTIIGLTKEEEALGIKSFQEKVWRSLRTREDFEQIDFDAIRENKEMLEKFTKTMLLNPQQLAEAARVFGRDFVDAVQQQAEELGGEWFYEINPYTGRPRAPGIPRYLATNGAFALGFAPLPGLEEREKMRKYEELGRHWADNLRRAQTPEEIEGLKKDLKKALEELEEEFKKAKEEEKPEIEIRRGIIESAIEAAEEKKKRLEEEELKPPRPAPPIRPEAGEREGILTEEEKRPEAGEE